MAQMHEVDYTVFGDDMQDVEIELDPGEAAVAEAGGMMYMEDGIQMETIFGDGSAQQGGFLTALVGAGKRLLTGESLFMTVFINQAGGRRKLAFWMATDVARSRRLAESMMELSTAVSLEGIEDNAAEIVRLLSRVAPMKEEA